MGLSEELKAAMLLTATIPQAIEDNICNLCGEDILSFSDEKSLVEYEISAMCQNCQDEIFTEDPYVGGEE
tara:strand:+ start:312 stop:521 length:210 start_codon:yes stop_codon:yes gene_type:complete